MPVGRVGFAFFVSTSNNQYVFQVRALRRQTSAAFSSLSNTRGRPRFLFDALLSSSDLWELFLFVLLFVLCLTSAGVLVEVIVGVLVSS